METCECDNTHKNNNTCCQHCWDIHGWREWHDEPCKCEEYEKIAFQRGAEAMRKAAMKLVRETAHRVSLSSVAYDISILPMPEDKP